MFIDPTALINIADTASDVANSKLFTTLVQVAAYITPYFLIPAAFKAGMGVFGALTGMLNDRSRGFFDKQRKYRQGKMDYNKQRLKAGERYGTRTPIGRKLNSASRRATTKNLGYGAVGREAYQQKINNAGNDFGKTAEGQAVQHNDGALRALTYSSAAAAREGLRKDFGMDDASIDSSIAAARASGGFSANKQTWAAAQLSRTGTGYDNIEQLSKTIARASNGNASQVAALAGDINSSTKQAGRHDLAPGFAKLHDLATSDLSGGATAAEYHAATVSAARGVDPMTLVRQKPKAVEALTTALDSHLESQTLRMQDTNLSPDQRSNAALEVKKTIGQISQLKGVSSYGPQDNQVHIVGLDASTEATVKAATGFLGQQPNAEEHKWDIEQFSNPRQVDPRLLDQDQRQ